MAASGAVATAGATAAGSCVAASGVAATAGATAAGSSIRGELSLLSEFLRLVAYALRQACDPGRSRPSSPTEEASSPELCGSAAVPAVCAELQQSGIANVTLADRCFRRSESTLVLDSTDRRDRGGSRSDDIGLTQSTTRPRRALLFCGESWNRLSLLRELGPVQRPMPKLSLLRELRPVQRPMPKFSYYYPPLIQRPK